MFAASFLIALALAVRLPSLSTTGLYRDDAWPLLAARTGLARAVRIGVTIPGFEVFLWAWGRVSTATVWAQAPALVASVTAVALAYGLARKLGCEPFAAVVAGGILALAPMAVLFSTRVKPYAVDAVVSLILFALAVRLAQAPSRRRWVSLTAVAVMAPLVSASVLPVALTAMAWSASRGWTHPDATRQSRLLALALPAGYVAMVALYAFVVLGNVPPPLHDSWASHYVDDLGGARYVFDEFAAGIFYRHGPTGPLLLVAIVAGVVWARPHLAALLLGPVLIAFGLAVVGRAPFGGGRTDIYLYPGVALAVALTVQRALGGRRLRWAGPAVTVALALFAVTDGRRHVEGNPYPGADTARLIALVRNQMVPGDAVVVAPFTRYAFALYDRTAPEVLLSSRYSTGFTVASPDSDVFILPAEFYETGYDAGAAVGFVGDRRRVWYLATDTPVTDTDPAVQAHEYEPEGRLLAEGFVIERRLDVRGAHAHLLVRH